MIRRRSSLAAPLVGVALVVVAALAACRDVPLDAVGWACERDAECGPASVCRARRCVPSRGATPVPSCDLTFGARRVKVTVADDADGRPTLVLDAGAGRPAVSIALPAGVSWPDRDLVAGCCPNACCEAP